MQLLALSGKKQIELAEYFGMTKQTGIRPTTINELYHELAERVNLDHGQ